MNRFRVGQFVRRKGEEESFQIADSLAERRFFRRETGEWFDRDELLPAGRSKYREGAEMPTEPEECNWERSGAFSGHSASHPNRKLHCAECHRIVKRNSRARPLKLGEKVFCCGRHRSRFWRKNRKKISTQIHGSSVEKSEAV